MATAPSPNDLTRQQLDELDALLQRMLSVPLSPTETPTPTEAPTLPTPPVTPPSWRVDPPAPAPVSSPHIAIPSEPPTPPPPVLKYEAIKHTPPAPAPAPQVGSLTTPHTPSFTAPQASPLPTPRVPVAAPQAAAPAPAPSAPVPFLLWPLVLFNMLFDRACGLFGFPGRVLRSGFFKFLYGLIGLGLLAYTAAHVAQERHWLTLPIQLPWPPAQWPPR